MKDFPDLTTYNNTNKKFFLQIFFVCVIVKKIISLPPKLLSGYLNPYF